MRAKTVAANAEAPALNRLLIGSLFMGLALILSVIQSRATEVQRVISPGGIEAWLVEDHTNPLIAVEFAFEGGAVQNPQGKEGLARLMGSLLDEGAGDLDSRAFQNRLEETSVRLSFQSSGELFRGSMTTLTRNLNDGVELLRLAVNEPRFDEEPVERIRNQIIIGLRQSETDPNRRVGRALFSTVFSDHPYGRPDQGTEESVAAITIEDLKTYHHKILARDTLKIGIVGAISAEDLAPLLDTIFGALPKEPSLRPVEDVLATTKDVMKVVDLDVPQSQILLAMPGIKRDDDDFMTAFVVNHIFGGGSFSSRLYDEVREKRGLVYSVFSYLYPFDHSGLIVAGAGTQNARVQESLDVISAEISRMGEAGPTAEELEKAKSFLIGSYALRFDTSAKIARQLVGLQVNDLGIDYFDTRNDKIRAVTLEDARRVATRLYNRDNLAIGIAGKPEGLTSRPDSG